MVMSATCNGTSNVINSSTVSDGCTLSSAVVFNVTEDISLNGTMRFGIDGATLVCNGHTIHGNKSNIGLSYWTAGTSQRDDITIENCKFANYTRVFEMKGDNNTFINITGLEGTTHGFYSILLSMKLCMLVRLVCSLDYTVSKPKKMPKIVLC